MKKYRCTKSFVVDCYDGGGFWVPGKEKIVNEGDIYILDESGITVIGADVHLDAEDGSWLELSHESLAEFFEEMDEE